MNKIKLVLAAALMATLVGCASNPKPPGVDQATWDAAKRIEYLVWRESRWTYPKEAYTGEPIEGRNIVNFYQGNYSIEQSSGKKILDDNSLKVAEKVTALLSESEKQQNISVPITYRVYESDPTCSAYTCNAEKDITIRRHGEKMKAENK